MQTFIPPAIAVTTSAGPQPKPTQAASRGANSTHDNKPFARQLEKQREARAQDSARPPAPSPIKNPQPTAERGQRAPKPVDGKRTEAANDQPRSVARLPAPRKADAASATEPVDAKPADEADRPTDIEAGADAGAAFITDWLARLSPAPETPPPQADATVAPPAPTATPTTTLTPSTAPLVATTSEAPDLADAGLASQTRGVEPGAAQRATAAQTRLPASPDARESVGANEWHRAQSATLSDAFRGTPEAPEQRQLETTVQSGTPFVTPNAHSVGSPVSLTGKMADAAPPLQLATPTTSPEFRVALGMQVSVLARSGVQQAELHLNPAEMGPVSIQIVLDGQQAQVNFGADSALTRQIIESGMPELASALREAGLTLTGGSVSQHAGGQRQDAGPQSPPNAARGDVHSGTPDEARSDTQLEQARRSAARSASGGVDLYA